MFPAVLTFLEVFHKGAKGAWNSYALRICKAHWLIISRYDGRKICPQEVFTCCQTPTLL